MAKKNAKAERPTLEKLSLAVEAECTYDPSRPNNFMHMKFPPADVMDGKKKVGSVSNCVGAGVEIEDAATGKTWYVSAMALWKAFAAAKVR